MCDLQSKPSLDNVNDRIQYRKNRLIGIGPEVHMTQGLVFD